MQTTTETKKFELFPARFVKGEAPKLSPSEARTRANAQIALRNLVRDARPYDALSGGSLGEIMGAPLELLPSAFSSFEDFDIPQPEAEFEARFAPEFSLINDAASQQSTGLLSKFVGAGSPVAPFIVRGVGLVARCDSEAWAMIGAAITPPAEGDLPTRVGRVVPVGGVPDDRNATPGVFQYNRDVVAGLFDLLQSYQLQYVVSGRLLLINERAFDIGSIDANNCVRGFGTGLADPRLVINEGNKHFLEIGSSVIFQDPNVTTADENGEPLEPNLVDLQYTTPYLPGIFGQTYPVKPHILLPGMNYQFIMVRRSGEQAYFNRLKARWTTPAGLAKVDDNFANSRPSNADGPAIWAGHFPFRYGKVQFGLMLRGCEMMPAECLRWFLMFGQPYANIAEVTPGMQQSLDALVKACGLSGIPKPLGMYGQDRRWSDKKDAIAALYDMRRDENGALAGFEPSSRPCSERELIAALGELITAEA